MISFGNHIKYIENVKSKIVGYLWFGNTLDIIRSGYIYIYIYIMLNCIQSCYRTVAVMATLLLLIAIFNP